jgi:thiosulfate dehydrogenase [quinone] large subunit
MVKIIRENGVIDHNHEVKFVITMTTKSDILVTITRVSFGWIFFWAFIDKAFGITAGTIESGYFGGKSPTGYFLGVMAAENTFGDIFGPMGGNAIVDFLFMFGLLGVGISLLLGIGRKIAGVSGALLMFMMWASQLPLANNPFMDDHLIYMFLFLIFGFTEVKGILFVPQWTKISEKYSFLE